MAQSGKLQKNFIGKIKFDIFHDVYTKLLEEYEQQRNSDKALLYENEKEQEQDTFSQPTVSYLFNIFKCKKCYFEINLSQFGY